MATDDEQVQRQQHALNQEIAMLIAEKQKFRQFASSGLAGILTAVRQAVQRAISNANPRSSERQSLVDIRGLGKPPTYKGESAHLHLLEETTGFLIVAHGSAFGPVIESVEDQDKVVTNESLEQQFGPLGSEPNDDVLEKSEQVHVGLSSGSSEWRKRTALLRQILVPDRCKLQGFPAGLEKKEGLVRRYERSKSRGTTTVTLNEEDFTTAALEALVPSEMEQHLDMNRARLITFAHVRSEIQAHIEARRSPFAFKTVAAKKHFRSSGCGQLWQRRQERRQGKKVKGDGKKDK